MEKGFKVLEIFGEIEDEYISEAAKPWKKRSIFRQKPWKIAAAGILLAIVLGSSLKYQEEVKAALENAASWIGRALGIEDGDAEISANVIGKSITQNGLTVTLNEIAADDRNLWIAYSDDSREGDEKCLSSCIKIDGEKLFPEESRNISVEEKPGTTLCVEKYAIEQVKNKKETMNVKIEIWAESIHDADFLQSTDALEKNTEPYVFQVSVSEEELEKNTIDLKLDQEIDIGDGYRMKLTGFRWNPFASTIYAECSALDRRSDGIFHEYYLKGYDDQGHEICYELRGYPEMYFELNMDSWFGNFEKISRESETLTLQLYEVRDAQENQEGFDAGKDDEYEISDGDTYGDGESPLDRGIPLGDQFDIQIR